MFLDYGQSCSKMNSLLFPLRLMLCFRISFSQRVGAVSKNSEEKGQSTEAMASSQPCKGSQPCDMVYPKSFQTFEMWFPKRTGKRESPSGADYPTGMWLFLHSYPGAFLRHTHSTKLLWIRALLLTSPSLREKPKFPNIAHRVSQGLPCPFSQIYFTPCFYPGTQSYFKASSLTCYNKEPI